MAASRSDSGFRTFLALWLTQSLSVFGTALTFFAINIWLAATLYPLPSERASLAKALVVTSLAFGVPAIFMAPIGGALADRMDRKRIMMTANWLSVAVSALLAWLMLEQHLTVWILALLVAAYSTLGTIHGSAFDSSYAMLVPSAHLPRANGMMQSMQSLSSLLSPSIAAALIALPAMFRQGGAGAWPAIGWIGRWSDGAGLAITIDALTFAVAAAVPLLLHVPSPERTELPGGAADWRADLVTGWTYIVRRRPLLTLLYTFAVANLLSSAMMVLEPVMLRGRFAADWQARHMTFEAALALLATSGALGGIAGGAMVSVWGGLKTRRLRAILGGLFVSALAQVLFGSARTMAVAATAAFVMTFMVPVANAHSQTIWQEHVAPGLQGRVFAARRIIAQCTWPLGTLVAGLAAGAISASVVISACGVVLAVVIAAQALNPQLRLAEDVAYLRSMDAQQ